MGDAPLSTNGFFQFTKGKSNNPNFLYIFSQVATYAFAIVNFRMGMRRNNHMVMLSAVSKMCGLFHGRNHPFYQLIEIYYMAQLFAMHDEFKPTYQQYSTISESGDPSKAEDWDFVLENVNKKTQSWIPKGIPTNDIWLTVCRNVDPLDELRSCHFEMIAMKKNSQGSRRRDLSAEIDEWRLVLRKSNYLIQTNFTSMNGNALEPELLNFTSISKVYRFHKIGQIFLDIDITDERLVHPIFVTPEEKRKYNDIHNMRKAQIKSKAIEKIKAIPCQDTVEYYLDYLKTSVNDRKSDLIQFYVNVTEFVDEVFGNDGSSSDEDD